MHTQPCLTLHPHGLWPARFLCLWNFPGKNTGVSCHLLLQKIFPTQGSNPHLLCLLHEQADSLLLSHLGSPVLSFKIIFIFKNCIVCPVCMCVCARMRLHTFSLSIHLLTDTIERLSTSTQSQGLS